MNACSVSSQQYDSETKKQHIITNIERKYKIPKLHKIIASAYKDINSLDPLNKRRYFLQVVTFILSHLQISMDQGLTLHESQQLIKRQLQIAVLDYSLGPVESLQCKIQSIQPKQLPDLCSDLQPLTKQKFTDRIKQLTIKCKEVSFEFNKDMQIILEKNGGYKFKGTYKSTGVKAYMRILTKIMQEYVDSNEGSRQVYTDINHYYWTPIFAFFNKLIDQNISKLKINMYDWIRCKVCYKTVAQLQAAYDRLIKNLSRTHTEIFRVQNRVSTHTRDVLINLRYHGQYGQIQLYLPFKTFDYDFMQKLQELANQKLGLAYSSFLQLLNQTPTQLSSNEGIMTKSGYIKRMLIRQEVQFGFQRCQRKQVQIEWEYVQQLIGKWEVIAMKTGFVRGKGYEGQKQRISNQCYGPDINQMLIIKKTPNDHLTTWLNWMDQI